MHSRPTRPLIAALALLAAACRDGGAPTGADERATLVTGPQATIASSATADAASAVFLVLDADAIQKETDPNQFSDRDINDDIKAKGQRRVLRWFAANVGRTIDLPSGEVGSEGFHAPTSVPRSWITAGSAGGGIRNLLAAAPGLGGQDNDNLLDKIAGVRPLRATGVTMLRGQAVCALVLAGDVGTNYAPLTASLQGDAYGIVAFDLVATRTNRGQSSTSLPWVTIRVRDAQSTCGGPLALFANAPAPRSSSEPNDIAVRATVPAPILTVAP